MRGVSGHFSPLSSGPFTAGLFIYGAALLSGRRNNLLGRGCILYVSVPSHGPSLLHTCDLLVCAWKRGCTGELLRAYYNEMVS